MIPPEVLVSGVLVGTEVDGPGTELVVSGLFSGTEDDGLDIDVAVSGLFVGTEVTATLLDGVTGYVVTVVRTGQLVTSGGQSVTVIVWVVYTTPPGVFIVDDEVPLVVGYGTLVTGTSLVKPLEAPVGYKVKELDKVLMLVLVLALLSVNEVDGLTREDELVKPVPVGPGREVEFQRPVLVGYGGMDDDPVPADALVDVIFHRPVLLGYVIDEEPVPALGPCVYVVAFQIPVLLG